MIRKIIRLPLEVAISLDQLANVLLLGSADETLSARAYRTEQAGLVFGRIFRPLIDTLLFFDRQHCQKSFERERARVGMAREYRE